MQDLVWISFASGILGVSILVMRSVIYSKCKKFSCCFGLIQCIRYDKDIDADVRDRERDRDNEFRLDIDIMDSPTFMTYSNHL